LTRDNSLFKIKIGIILRPKHPNKDIEQALRYAKSKKWRYVPSGSSAHSWGKILEGHSMSIWSTPKR
jgi:hypothetical protein